MIKHYKVEYVYRNLHMMSQRYRKSISLKIIQLYSKTLRATWKVLENLHLQHLLSHNYFAKYFSKKKTTQLFHDHVAYDYNREYKNHWSVTTIRMAYIAHPYNPRSLSTCDLKMMVLVCFVINCDIFQQKSWICKLFCEKSFSCRQAKPFCSI